MNEPAHAAAEWTFEPPVFSEVRASQVSRAFGRAHALYECTAALVSGETVAVVGPNGAGKTTLLHLLATLDRPTSGAIRFLPSTTAEELDSVRDRHRIRRHIGLVAHDSLLYAELSGLENLRFVARLYGREVATAGLWLDRVGLTGAGDRPVADYSRGMRQRLSIARALLPEPSLVLFDEPLTGLDRSARAFLYATIDRLRAAGRLVVIVTHHLDWPTEHLDRAMVLDGGRMRYTGPVDRPLGALYAAGVGA